MGGHADLMLYLRVLKEEGEEGGGRGQRRRWQCGKGVATM